MDIYRYDPSTYEYLYAEEAAIDPLETELQGTTVYLIPPNSTFTPPPSLDTTSQSAPFAIKWTGTEWAIVKDHRQRRDQGGVIIEGTGTPYWLPGDTYDSSPRYMMTLDDFPKDAIFTRPEKPLEKLREEKLQELSSKTSAAESDAYVVSSVGSPGIKINANERANRDIEGLIKLLKSFPEDTTEDFCCYDNTYYPVTLQDLETMQLEVITNGHNLYKQKWAYRNAINSASTKEELDAIHIEFQMLNFSAV